MRFLRCEGPSVHPRGGSRFTPVAIPGGLVAFGPMAGTRRGPHRLGFALEARFAVAAERLGEEVRMESGMKRALALLGLWLAFGCAHPAPEWRPAAQPEPWAADGDSTWFIQMADTQFGMYATPLLFSYLGWSWNRDSFERETVNMELAIAHTNRLRPRFAIVCGDLVDSPGHAGQIAEFRRIAGQLDEGIPFYVVAGNHDVENAPTPDALAAYRATFGPDWYSFREGDVYGIVLNSQLLHSPQHVPDEAAAQLAWLRAELAKAKASGAGQVLVFQHHPFFLVDPDEDDQYFNIPRRDGATLYLWRCSARRAFARSSPATTTATLTAGTGRWRW